MNTATLNQRLGGFNFAIKFLLIVVALALIFIIVRLCFPMESPSIIDMVTSTYLGSTLLECRTVA